MVAAGESPGEVQFTWKQNLRNLGHFLSCDLATKMEPKLWHAFSNLVPGFSSIFIMARSQENVSMIFGDFTK